MRGRTGHARRNCVALFHAARTRYIAGNLTPFEATPLYSGLLTEARINTAEFDRYPSDISHTQPPLRGILCAEVPYK